METLRFWARPAIIAGLWIAAASFTLAELTTVLPSLRGGHPGTPVAVSDGSVSAGRHPRTVAR